jgi:hypothetical protein
MFIYHTKTSDAFKRKLVVENSCQQWEFKCQNFHLLLSLTDETKGHNVNWIEHWMKWHDITKP